MGMARFIVAMEFLRDALAIPDDVTILQILRRETNPYVYIFYVEGEGLPDRPAGSMTEMLQPVMTWLGDDRPRDFIRFEWIKESDDGGYLLHEDAAAAFREEGIIE